MSDFLTYPDVNFAYASSPPMVTAAFKRELSDFKVTEILGFEPTGDGEHIFIRLEKTGLNTAYIAEQLASFVQLPLRNVTYAGRKDKFSQSTQWFGIHSPGKKTFNWDDFQLEGVQIIEITRHDKKLRTGVLKHNHFAITLRAVSDMDELLARIHRIEQCGVPNYYGQQRFGEVRFLDEQGQQQTKVGGNLLLAEQLFTGGKIKNRNKRSVAISALRSWIFNVAVAQRVSSGSDKSIESGDAVMLSGTNSFFVAQEADLPDLQRRFVERDLDLTAPLWGAGKLVTQGEQGAHEQHIAQRYPDICAALVDLGLKQERRAMHLYPQELTTQVLDSDTLLLQFALPVGCFATSILRECCVTHQQDFQA